MFFLLRCTFWLMVVFSSMDWTGMDWAPHGGGVLAAVASGVAAKAQDSCAKAPVACLEVAAKLQSAMSSRSEPKAPIAIRPVADTLREADREAVPRTPIHPNRG